MSIQGLAVRPAIDSRPPAEPWAGLSDPGPPVSPGQPPLRLIEESASRTLVTAPAPARTPVCVDVDPAGVDADRAEELVDQARTWAPWFAQLLVEALDGRRAMESLGRWLDEWVLAEVSRRVRLQRRVRSRPPSAAPTLPAAVVSLRTQFSSPRVLEVAVHVRRGRRSSAWAFQLVRGRDRWRCTEIALGPLPSAGRDAGRT
jgi:hypothetical protein